IGVIVGILFAWLRRSESPGGLVIDMIVGIVGGFIGGVVLNALGGLVGAEVIGVNLGGAIVAIVGAAVLIGLWALLRGTPER
ncbi:MAG: GlsB/YeaQ/YmgE family stress response membrane protein, partial [Anaerolineae bacterium]|nr:GlsB/YeaQ/YmgE family stress response membrane protein [Anaerolineae bacterium]